MARATLEMFLKLTGANKTSQGLDKVSKSTKQLDANVKNSTKQNTQFAAGMSGLSKAAIAGASLFAAKSILEFSKSALEAAVSAEEAGAAFDTTFGTAAERATVFLEGFANKAGLTVGEAQQLQATLGAVAQGIGFTQEASADLSIELTKIAADVASFSNISAGAEPVLQAFRSALVGEREALKTYGIAITEAEVQTKAFEQTGKDNADALNRQEKALATLTLIQEKAAVQIGDLDRTAQSFANQSRALNAELRQLNEEIGQELIPIATELLPIFREFAFEIAPALVRGFGGFFKQISDITLGLKQFRQETSLLSFFLAGNRKTLEEWADEYRANQVVQDRYIDRANLSAVQTAFLTKEQEKSRQAALRQETQYSKVANTLDKKLNPLFTEQNKLIVSNIQLEVDRRRLLDLISAGNESVAQATKNRNQAAKELEELQIQENVRDAEAAIRKAELQTQIALLTEAQSKGKDVTLDLALAEAELAEAEFELANESDRLKIARDALTIAENNLEAALKNQEKARVAVRDALIGETAATKEDTKERNKNADAIEKQLDLLRRFRAIETAPLDRFKPTIPETKPTPEPTLEISPTPAPLVSDRSGVIDSGLQKGGGETTVIIPVSIGDEKIEEVIQKVNTRIQTQGKTFQIV